MRWHKSYCLFLLALCLNSCHVGRFFVWNFADANDHKKFAKIDIKTEGAPFQFQDVTSADLFKTKAIIKKGKSINNFEEGLKKSGTVAFLVIRNDSILYENYFSRRDASSIHPSFSMAKSVVSMLVGIALEEGKILSIEESITKYLPELKGKEGFSKITIEHLLDMRSGISFNESYINPFGNAAKYYYGLNIKKYINKLTIAESPDQYFDYISVNTQLLALIVENATKTQITSYLQEKIWEPLNMEYDASWSIDSKKHQTVKAFCCLNARARDFAKLGRLYLNQGNWNGKQIISKDWVQQSTTFTKGKNLFMYSYQWWHNNTLQRKSDTMELPPLYIETKPRVGKSTNSPQTPWIFSPYPDFYAEGILGQYIYVHPEKNMVIVRLGKKYGGVSWNTLFRELAEMN